jgi:hypothetical protein
MVQSGFIGIKLAVHVKELHDHIVIGWGTVQPHGYPTGIAGQLQSFDALVDRVFRKGPTDHLHNASERYNTGFWTRQFDILSNHGSVGVWLLLHL